MPFPNYQGHKRFWTRERVLAALEKVASKLGYPLPCSDNAYLKLKKGHLDWPPATRIYGYFGSLAGGWFALGIPKSELNFGNQDWSAADEEYLLEHAGTKTLDKIGKHLGRTYPAVKTRLYNIGITARDNQGFLSAAQIAREYNCSVDRVKRFLSARVIKGWYDGLRHRWQVNPSQITPDVLQKLQAPRQTYKTFPVDKGDYESRHKLRRHMLNGKLIRIAATERTNLSATIYTP